jgi:small GTP-binding protein
MSSKKFDYSLKYIIVGEAGVGKSNLLLRYVYDSFKEDYQLTIGVEFGEKLVKYNNKTYKIQIWDTAGQEQFRSITRAYFKSSICSFVVYDITNRETFENVKHWVEDCRNYMPKNVLIISDMEIDMATYNYRTRSGLSATLFETLAHKYEEAGYKLPKLIFWNVNSRTNTIPITQNENGVVLLSGFSKNLMSMVMSNELDPYKALVSELMVPRYDVIETIFSY